MNRAAFILFGLLLILFGAGLVHLYQLRYAYGDVYPPYSSLRSDPLGTRALLESLGQIRPAERHFRSLTKLPSPTGRTLFYLGVEPASLNLPQAEAEALDLWIRRGGRLVAALRPVESGPGQRGSSPPPSAPLTQPEFSPPSGPKKNLLETWDIAVGQTALRRNEAGRLLPAEASLVEEEGLPDPLMVRTPLHFSTSSPPWRVLYERRKAGPVLMERSWGQGQVVFCADAYLLSNEALLVERHPGLLSWLAGPSQFFLFDETHLGVRRTTGIPDLARKYRLHGLFGALLLLAVFFVWRQVMPFLPRTTTWTDPDTGGMVTGRESAAGLANLLRRNIPPGQLMRTCLEAWIAQVKPERSGAKHRLQRMQQLIDAENARPAGQDDPVRLYNQLAETLSQSPSSSTRRTSS